MSLYPRYPEILSYLYSLQKFGIKLGLSHMEALMTALGAPHRQFSSILIGGTNGKGSTAAFLESILRESGFRTGLYTSPHLLDFRERIRVGGEPISEGDLIAGVDRLRDLISSLLGPETPPSKRLLGHPTFFEVATALAFHYFAQKEVEMAVVEVGMGGRYDATNILSPLLSIITNVDLDHREFLGESLEQIAQEKAGIIKEGGWVVSGANLPEAKEVIQQVAMERGAKLLRLESDITWDLLRYTWEGQQISIRGREDCYPDLEIPLLGGHQGANAAAAVATAEILKAQGHAIARTGIYRGLAKAHWPGRIQVIGRNPRIVVDSAHNPAGARALSRAMIDLDRYDHLYLIFGVLKDKEWTEMLEALAPLAHRIILTKPPSERAADPLWLQEELRGRWDQLEVREEMGEALSYARSMARRGDLILIAGSLFTAAGALKLLGVGIP